MTMLRISFPKSSYGSLVMPVGILWVFVCASLIPKTGAFQVQLDSRISYSHPKFGIRRTHATVQLPTHLHVSSSSALSSSSGSGSYGSGVSAPALGAARLVQHKDVVIVGGGLAGLSTALYLSQLDPSRQITILDREDHAVKETETTVASFAAAGMLAPQSERLPKGSLLDLCLASRQMYTGFCNLVETLAMSSGEEGQRFLKHNTVSTATNKDKTNHRVEPWSVGYIASGGFLAPAFAGDAVATWAPPEDSGSAVWLDAIQVREFEPNLHPEVVGGWWFPEDASVDARRLTHSLLAACTAAGVHIKAGESYQVTALDLNNQQCKGLWLQNGAYYSAKSVLVANGAWMRNLLPVPIEPHKGQSLSLKMPDDAPPILRRVLFAQDSYIVPKADGHIVIGATVEAGSFDGNVTPRGIMHILEHALMLVPGLADLPIKETWAGLRPTTPDKGPILGETPWKNLFVAGGYWRNGVLLAPKTGQLLASLICGKETSKEDNRLLKAFAWDRFLSEEGGKALAASTRYAASMHPIHSRRTGAGVAAAVGTELGFYSTARSGKMERQKDRESLWDFDSDSSAKAEDFTSNTDESAFERAANLGREDGSAYSFGVESEDGDDNNMWSSDYENEDNEEQQSGDETSTYEGSADAITVGSAEGVELTTNNTTENKNDNDINSIYKAIQDRKSKTESVLPEKVVEEKRKDPGFRIYHVDAVTKEKREVPPYTSPGEFFKMIEEEKAQKQGEQVEGGKDANAQEASEPYAEFYKGFKMDAGEGENYSEKTYDGYQAIQEANSRGTREEELEAMRESRKKNRLGQEKIDMSKIGAQRGPISSAKSDASD